MKKPLGPCECKFLNILEGIVKIEPHQITGRMLGQCPFCETRYFVSPETWGRERISWPRSK